MSRNPYIISIISTSQLIPCIIDAWDRLIVLNDARLKDQALYDHAQSWLKKLFRNFKNDKDFPIDVAVRLQIIRGSPRWGCFGHLFKLSNTLVGIIQQTSAEFGHGTQREVWVGYTENERWKKFVDEVLRVYNAISQQKLDQDCSSESQESSDENDD